MYNGLKKRGGRGGGDHMFPTQEAVGGPVVMMMMGQAESPALY